MSVDDDLAIAYANLKGSKHKDFMGTARALARLKRQPEYNSNARLGEAVGVSGEMVREFLALLKLPVPVQKLFERGDLKLEHGRRLFQLSIRMPDKVEEVAAAVAGMTAMDARALIEYVLKNPRLPVDQAKSRVLNAKTRAIHEFAVMAVVREDEYKRLNEHARRRRVTLDKLVTSIVEDWLENKG